MLALTLMAHYGSAPCPFRLRHIGREAKSGKLSSQAFVMMMMTMEMDD